MRTHTCAHTHTHTHTWAAIYAAALWKQLRVQCHAQGHLSRGNEGGESAVHSLRRDCPPKIDDLNSITSPTLFH